MVLPRRRSGLLTLYSPECVEEAFSEVRLASGAHIWSLMSTMAKLAPAKMTASKPKTGAV